MVWSLGGVAGEMRNSFSASIVDLSELGNWTSLEGCLSSWGEHLAGPKACRDSRVTGGRGCTRPWTFRAMKSRGFLGAALNYWAACHD